MAENNLAENNLTENMERDPMLAQGEARSALATAPLLEALARQVVLPAGFHMPGHQRGGGLWEPFAQLWAAHGAALDLTELPGLDVLGAAAGCLAASQQATAALYGAHASFYLVNGATVGLAASLLAMSRPGSQVVLPAHSHMALQSGLVLSGARPVILPSQIDPGWGLPLGADPAAVDWVIGQGRLAEKGLWITVSPTYHGLIADLPHQQGLLQHLPGWRWLVDEAHGVHLPFVSLPDGKAVGNASALAWQADVVVQSTHKMGAGLTQTGLLHCREADIAEACRHALNLLQSSSPSYLLLASLDAWQAGLQETLGKNKLQEATDLAIELADDIRRIGDYRLWQDELPFGTRQDPGKLTISAEALGLSGPALGRILEKEYGIVPELAMAGHILLLVTLGHSRADTAHLVHALRCIRETYGKTNAEKTQPPRPAARLLAAMYGRPDEANEAIEPCFSPREAFFQPYRLVALAESCGLLSARALVPYPPGVPLIYPGMVLEKAVLEQLEEWLAAGQSCLGIEQKEGQAYVYVIAG